MYLGRNGDFKIDPTNISTWVLLLQGQSRCEVAEDCSGAPLMTAIGTNFWILRDNAYPVFEMSHCCS